MNDQNAFLYILHAFLEVIHFINKITLLGGFGRSFDSPLNFYWTRVEKNLWRTDLLSLSQLLNVGTSRIFTKPNSMFTQVRVSSVKKNNTINYL